MATIERQDPVQLSQSWGASFSDYKVRGEQVDFQDLMVAIAQNRAVTVEGEVAPLSARIKNRNKELEQLGDLLAIFTQTQSSYDSEAEGSAVASVRGVTEEMIPLACEAYRRKGGNPGTTIGWWNSDGWTKASVEGMLQELKSMIDARNNESQKDMKRLESLVDRRDEAFSTATDLMSEISDTRSTLIGNL